MAVDLRNLAAFVTGGARGIGRAVCQALLEKQVKVCFADVIEEAGRQTEREFKEKYGEKNVMFIKCDVTSTKDFEESLLTAKNKFGHLDILINNAGVLMEDNWERCIDINLKGVMRGTTLAFQHLSNKDGKKGGFVVNTASTLSVAVTPCLPAYCTSKFGVGAWTRCMGDEENVKKTGVKVSGICPGPTMTPMVEQFLSSDKSEGASSSKLQNSILEKSQTPSDVAKGFIRVLEEGKSGVLLAVTPDKGEYYLDIPTY